MAGPQARRNASPPAGKDELAGDVPGVPIKGSGTHTLTLAAFRAPTLAPAPVPGPLGRYTDENLQRATKLALDSFVRGQEHGQIQANTAPRERPLKAWFPDLYYRNSHLDCYCFCQ